MDQSFTLTVDDLPAPAKAPNVDLSGTPDGVGDRQPDTVIANGTDDP